MTQPRSSDVLVAVSPPQTIGALCWTPSLPIPLVPGVGQLGLGSAGQLDGTGFPDAAQVGP